MDDLDFIPETLRMSTRHIHKLSVALKELEGITLSKVTVEYTEPEKMTDTLKKALDHLEFHYAYTDNEFLKKLVFVSKKITAIIRKVGNDFEEEVKKTFTGDDADCARYFFITRMADHCKRLFATLRSGRFETLEDVTKLYIVSNFGHAYCFDMMWQMVHFLIKDESDGPSKTH